MEFKGIFGQYFGNSAIEILENESKSPKNNGEKSWNNRKNIEERLFQRGLINNIIFWLSKIR